MKNNMKTTVLITGASGFIGNNFIQYLLNSKEKFRIIAESRNKTDYSGVENISCGEIGSM